jgi:hypothetical protein
MAMSLLCRKNRQERKNENDLKMFLLKDVDLSCLFQKKNISTTTTNLLINSMKAYDNSVSFFNCTLENFYNFGKIVTIVFVMDCHVRFLATW